MDDVWFDALTRSLSKASSRRGVLASFLGGTLGLLGFAEMTAKKKKHKKKHRSSVSPPPGSPPSPPVCTPSCTGGQACQVGGVCVCPDGTQFCPGSQSCRQCCSKADCALDPAETGSGVPECSADGVCVCATAGTRFCASRKRCGVCCSTLECTSPFVCDDTSESAAFVCRCPFGTHACTAAGRTGCIEATAECQAACNVFCNPTHETPCPCDLVCDFDPAHQEDDYHCAAP